MSSVSAALESSLITSFGVKLLSFIVSILTVRFSSISDFGKISVQYQLVVSLPLFLMKEGFRRAAIREQSALAATRITKIGVWSTLVLIGLNGIIAVNIYHENTLIILLISTGLAIETIAEFLLLHQLIVVKNFASRTIAETWSNFTRSVCLLLFLFLRFQVGTAFALAQIVHGLVWFVLLAKGIDRRTLSSLLFAHSSSTSFNANNMVEMTLSAIQKFLLTEGERIVAVSTLNSDEMGQLGLISNLGSIVLRLLFAPMEDAQTKKKNDRLRIIKAIFSIQLTIGLLGVVWGPLVAHQVIHTLYGYVWSSRTDLVFLLKIYCVFLLTCSANGPLEAYYFAVADSRKVRHSMISQAVAFALFLLSNVISKRWIGFPPPLAIVTGNIVAMMMRIMWSSTVFLDFRDFLHLKFRLVLLRVGVGGGITWILANLITHKTISMMVISSMGVATLMSIIRPLRSMLSDAKSA
jgi:oligosaccharide translocation protein RFT1